MKISKKIIALFAVASMMVSSAVTASAKFSTLVVPEKVTAEVGETITLEATFDTLSNAKAASLEFKFDADAFTVDTSDNEGYNFGTPKKPKYYPMWMSEGFISNYLDEMAFLNCWDSFAYNTVDGICAFTFYDTSNTVITAEDEAEDMYPYRTVGVNLTTVKDGTFTVTVNAVVSDDTVGDINSTKTITVVVGNGGEEDDNKPVDMVAGVDEIAYGRHEGKASIVTPTAVAFDGLAKIVVSNSKVAETQTWEAPTTLGEGKSSVLAIITYDKAAWAGSTFTVNFLNAAEAVIKAFTYTVQ